MSQAQHLAPPTRSFVSSRTAPVLPVAPVLRFDEVGIGESSLRLRAYPGEIVHLGGGSAVTRLRVLALAAGFAQGGSGRCEILGHDLMEIDDGQRRALRERHIGRVLACDHLGAAATVLASVALPLVRLGAPINEALARAALELDALGVGELGGRAPHSLAHGEARLALLARAMVTRPRLLVLEQPEESLSAAALSAVRLAFWALSSTFDTCVVMSTENPRLLASADRFVDIDRGTGPRRVVS